MQIFRFKYDTTFLWNIVQVFFRYTQFKYHIKKSNLNGRKNLLKVVQGVEKLSVCHYYSYMLYCKSQWKLVNHSYKKIFIQELNQLQHKNMKKSLNITMPLVQLRINFQNRTAFLACGALHHLTGFRLCQCSAVTGKHLHISRRSHPVKIFFNSCIVSMFFFMCKVLQHIVWSKRLSVCATFSELNVGCLLLLHLLFSTHSFHNLLLGYKKTPFLL